MTQEGTSGPGVSGSGAGPHTGFRPLHRSSDDRIIAGVCGGLGRYFGIDPVIFRIVLGVLAVFGGIGLLLYAVGWLVIPDDAPYSPAARPLAGRGPLPMLIAVAIGVVGLIVVADVFAHGHLAFVVVVVTLAALAALVVSQSGQAGSQPAEPAPPPAPPPPAPPPAAPGAHWRPPTGWTPPPPWAGATAAAPTAGPVAATAPARPPSLLFPIAAFVGVTLAGVLLALGAAGTLDVTAQAVFAAALLTVGLALVVGTWVGRARALIPLGAILTVLVAVTAVLDVPLRGGVGTRWYTVSTASDLAAGYHLAAGTEHLDLSRLQVGGTTRHVDATLGAGVLDVQVPPDTSVVVKGSVGAGRLEVFGTVVSGTDISRTVAVPGSAEQSGELDLDVHVGLGRVHVWARGS